MDKKKRKEGERTNKERAFAPFAFLTGNPTNPVEVPFSSTAPEGLALVYTASNSSEADWVRQVLRDAGFHVEFVPSATTGAFGMSGSVHVYVHTEEVKEALEFLRELQEKSLEELNMEDQS